jgi:hypothetical protein
MSCRPALALVLILVAAAPAAALDVYRTMDEAGVITIYAPDASVLSVEIPGAPGETTYLGAGDVVAGWCRPDPVFGGVAFYGATGEVVGRSLPNYGLGWDYFGPEGSYRGMSIDVSGTGYDVDRRGALLAEGLFPVPLQWSLLVGTADIGGR